MAVATPLKGSRSPQASAERFLSKEERWARQALRRASLTWWNASLSGKPRDYARMEAAEKVVNHHYSRPTPFRQASRLLQEPSLEALTRRRLERIQRAYRGMQAPRDLLDRITAESANLQEKYSTFRATFEGEQRTDNELEDILRTTDDNNRARTAWEARKQIGLAVADDVRRLAELRNEAARAIGFPDFWHQQLELDELDPGRLLQTLEAVHRATEQPFRAMKLELDLRLAERFHVLPESLRPWHYGDPFFQETPDVFAPPADPLYANKDVVEVAAQTYRALGFTNIDAILARSDLYPRKGKNQHAYAVDIDREGDVRTFLNVERNARWMGTLLHELGHTIYQDGIDRKTLAWDLRDDPQGFLNEGFAMFCEQPMFEPAWLSEKVGVAREEAARLAPRLLAQETASLLAFLRWCLTIVNFERVFYADPAQDLNTLWWDLEEHYQSVPRPESRDAPDWATKVHVATAPVYYHKYLYGRLFSAQLAKEINRRFGGWWGGRDRSGCYIKEELFAPGATFRWPELVQRVTGKPLGVEALAQAVAWPQAGNGS
jgi:peptidyl-dipeptidase A